jgi:uncharacterized integral membrane protein
MDDPDPTDTTRMPTPDATRDIAPDVAATPPSETAAEGPPAAPPPVAPPPTWSVPPRRDRGDGGRIWTLVIGLLILGLGVWFFLERTLEIEMPSIRWSQLWPVILIVIGAVVLLGALRRERR